MSVACPGERPNSLRQILNSARTLAERAGVMRRFLLALLITGGFGIAGSASGQTATQYPFCIQGVDNPGWSGCSFNTLQECQASASGTEAECLSNPWYQASDNGTPASGGNPPGVNGAIPVGPPPNTRN